MKLFAIILAMLAIINSSMALKHPICGLPHSVDGFEGRTCLGFFPVFTYQAETNECTPFIYGGCGGNKNRFETQDECERKCKE